MDITNRVEAAKPYAVGFVAGLIAAPVIAFGMGWVTTSGAKEEAVQNARIETLAGLCTTVALASWEERNLELADLQGRNNRAKRDELVAEITASLGVPDTLLRRVSNACSRNI